METQDNNSHYFSVFYVPWAVLDVETKLSDLILTIILQLSYSKY